MAEADSDPPQIFVAAKNRALWAKVKVKVGTNPFKHKVFDGFSPVFPAAVQGGVGGEIESTNKHRPGRMINSYNGSQLARSTAVTTLVQRFITGAEPVAGGQNQVWLAFALKTRSRVYALSRWSQSVVLPRPDLPLDLCLQLQ